MDTNQFQQAQQTLANILRASAIYRVPLASTHCLCRGQAPAAVAQVYVAGLETGSCVTEILLHNSDTVVRSFALHFVVVGDTGTTANRFIYLPAMGAGQHVIEKMQTTLLPGEMIWVVADSAAKVNYRISGIEVPST